MSGYAVPSSGKRAGISLLIMSAMALTGCGYLGEAASTPTAGLPAFPTIPARIETTPLPTVSLPMGPAPDFAFSLEFAVCYSETINTFDGSFTRDTTAVAGGSRLVIPLELAKPQMTAIYTRMRAINLWSYPADFKIPVWAGGGMALVGPAVKYRVLARASRLSRTVSWTDDIVQPTTTDAHNLRGLFSMIIDMVREHPAYSELPPPEFGCL